MDIKLPDLSGVTLSASDVAYRVMCAVNIINHIRSRLVAGEVYSGGMIPNLQSAIDVFVIPMGLLVESMEKCPPELTDLRPTPSDVAACARTLAGGDS